jgi:acetoin utilization protein AcuA
MEIRTLSDPSRVDIAPGFHAVTRSPELRGVLADVLKLGAVVTAALDGAVLVGYAVDLPYVPIVFDGIEVRRRWQRLPDVRELGALEVARGVRGEGLGRRLLTTALQSPRLDGQIVIGEGLAWHWDAEARGLGLSQCRAALLRLFESTGFRRYRTDEPEVAYSPYNFLVARVGAKVPVDSRLAFEAALMSG